MRFVKTLVIAGLYGAVASGAQAAEWQCYPFVVVPVTVKNPARIPGIELLRDVVNGEVHVYSQEIVPTNEKVDDALSKFKEGDEICLKGTKGRSPVNRFFAYDVK